MDTYHIVLASFEVILYTFHISFTIFLFFDKSNNFNGAFFIIIKIIFLADLGFWLQGISGRLPGFGLFPEFYKYNGWLGAVNFFVANYFAFMQFIGQTFLALNRFTALWIPLKHKYIWRFQWYTILIFIFSIIPIAPQLPVSGIYIHQPDGSVIIRFVKDSAMETSFQVTNGIFCSTTVIGLIINILSVARLYKLKKNQIVNENTKEAHLLCKFIKVPFKEKIFIGLK